MVAKPNNINSFIYSPPADTGLDILFKDEHLLVLNKPCGLLTVPGKDESKQDSLALRVQAQFSDALIVHRLDMFTSGIVLMALGKNMHRKLSLLFQHRKVDKTYIAIVDGFVKKNSGSINLPLIVDWPNRPKQKVDFETGKPSLTHYSVIEHQQKNNTTRVELKPETGRTHQLRVHMQAIGHAVLGDRLYATEEAQKKSSRLLLHATELSFSHPVGEETMIFYSSATF